MIDKLILLINYNRFTYIKIIFNNNKMGFSIQISMKQELNIKQNNESELN